MTAVTITNFLSDNDAKSVGLAFLEAREHWEFSPTTSPNVVKTPAGLIIKDTLQFVRYLDESNWVVRLLRQRFEEITKKKVIGVLRAKANMTFPVPSYPITAVCPLHVDVIGNKSNVITAVYYINDSDGDLVLFDSKNNRHTENCRVTPMSNTLVYFPSSVFHAKQPPKKYTQRCVINLNFIIDGVVNQDIEMTRV